MYKDFLGWSLENINAGTVETKYTVEYVNDKKTWDKINYIDDHYCEIEPRKESYELYSKREFNNVSEALNFYLTWFVSEDCYYIQLWEQIFVNGEMVLEQMMEPTSTTLFSMRTAINRETANRMYKAEKQAEEIMKENKLLYDFISFINREEMLDEYIKRYGGNL